MRRREDGGEVRRRVRTGANTWRAVEGLMADRRISKRLKGKVMSTFVTPADTPQFRGGGGNPYFFSETLYQSVSLIDASMYRDTFHAIRIAMQFAKSATL